MEYVFLIDPGSKKSGFVLIHNGCIVYAETLLNSIMVNKILSAKRVGLDMIVLFEDIRAYSVQLGQSTINTCKFLGELEYRLKEAAINCKPIDRWEVKRWVYDKYRRLSDLRIWKKIKDIQKKATSDKEISKAQKLRPHYFYVDDRIVTAAMKEEWGIPTPLPGKKSMYGLETHSWQALALYSVFKSQLPSLSNAQTEST